MLNTSASHWALAANEAKGQAAIYPANLVLAHRAWSHLLDDAIASVITTGLPVRVRASVEIDGHAAHTLEATVARGGEGIAVIFDAPNESESADR